MLIDQFDGSILFTVPYIYIYIYAASNIYIYVCVCRRGLRYSLRQHRMCTSRETHIPHACLWDKNVWIDHRLFNFAGSTKALERRFVSPAQLVGLPCFLFPFFFFSRLINVYKKSVYCTQENNSIPPWPSHRFIHDIIMQRGEEQWRRLLASFWSTA